MNRFKPKEYLTNDEILISSTIQLNCSLSNSMITQWNIFRCEKDCLTFNQMKSFIEISLTEIEIPSELFPIGLYRIEFIVQIKDLNQSTFTFIQISSSPIQIHLIPLGTSFITIGKEQNLFLNPIKYSLSSFEQSFDHQEWNWTYHCHLSHFSSNETCLQKLIKENSLNKSLLIPGNSFQSDQIYEISFHLINRLNASIQSKTFLFVQVKERNCVLLKSCLPKSHVKYVNSKRDLSLYSICIEYCLSIQSFQWNIFHRNTNNLQWNRFYLSKRNSFFRLNQSYLTISKEFFYENNQILDWRFELVYSYEDTNSSTRLDIRINQCPTNGLCQISPLFGTTETLFTIDCYNWFDEDSIKDYSFYSWDNDQNEQLLFAFTRESRIEVRLPPGDEITSKINIKVVIRDIYDCQTQIDMKSIIVISDLNLLRAYQK